MKLQLAILTSLSFLMAGCSHLGNGCYNPSTGLVHSGPCGLFDNCGTGICKKKPCKCRSGCKNRCRQSCDPCQPHGQFGAPYSDGSMIYGDGAILHEGTGSSYCPNCEGHHSSQYPELMVPHGEFQNRILPAPAAEGESDSQTFMTPIPSHGLTIPPVSYSTEPVYQPAQYSVPVVETSAF